MTRCTYYYETPIYENGNKTVSYSSKTVSSVDGRTAYIGPRLAMYQANRVWMQNDTGIYFVKNRNSDPLITPVDLEEFIMVKLRAQSI